MAQAGFWDKPEAAQATVGELKAVSAVVKPLRELVKSAGDLDAMLELADEDEGLAAEIQPQLDRLTESLADLELKALLSGPHDPNNAILSINARDGGTDANDWAEMLLRMYIHWAEDHGYEVELLDRQDNEQAGINNASVIVRGPMAYGYLKGETGMHRLVRISPFNAEGKRQTSFAAVDVSPEVPESAEIEIDDEDVREDVFRASGAGGQHVNKTSSAIRLTHLPTGVVVQCQQERSQHKNRARRKKMLRARLARLEEEKREAEQAAKYEKQAKTGFGSQIRNYFLHPDQRVKDARTGYSVGNFQSVMDGKIQPFLDAFLAGAANRSRMTVKVPEPLEVGGLRLVWLARGDRLGHRLELVTRSLPDGSEQTTPLLESIDATADEADALSWPASPPLTEWHVEQQAETTVLMAVGRATRSHWSAAISAGRRTPSLCGAAKCQRPPSPPAGEGSGVRGRATLARRPVRARSILYDVACRASQPPAWLGSRYRLSATPHSANAYRVELCAAWF